MNVQTLLAPDAGPPLGPSRARVLDLLRAAGSSLGVKEVADRAGLHSNTARFHLDALVEAGLAARALCVPTTLSTALTRRVALPASGRDDHRSCACGSCFS